MYVHGGETSRIVCVENVGAFYLAPFFAHICIWSAFVFYSSEDTEIIHTPRQTGKNTKRFTHSRQQANVKEQTHTQKQTSKINIQAFCITFLLKKNLYPVGIHNFEPFEFMNSLQGSTLVLIFNAGKCPSFLG